MEFFKRHGLKIALLVVVGLIWYFTTKWLSERSYIAARIIYFAICAMFFLIAAYFLEKMSPGFWRSILNSLRRGLRGVVRYIKSAGKVIAKIWRSKKAPKKVEGGKSSPAKTTDDTKDGSPATTPEPKVVTPETKKEPKGGDAVEKRSNTDWIAPAFQNVGAIAVEHWVWIWFGTSVIGFILSLILGCETKTILGWGISLLASTLTAFELWSKMWEQIGKLLSGDKGITVMGMTWTLIFLFFGFWLNFVYRESGNNIVLSASEVSFFGAIMIGILTIIYFLFKRANEIKFIR